MGSLLAFLFGKVVDGFWMWAITLGLMLVFIHQSVCLVSLKRVLTFCLVGIGWGLSILSNSEKPEHSGICCWPNWQNLRRSELFLAMENLKQKSCSIAWCDLTHLSSFSPGKPAIELAVRTELLWAASLNWGCWTWEGKPLSNIASGVQLVARLWLFRIGSW